ncbi:MAG TPA: glycoside hydrolase family 88 protein [Phycisphaerae bacterium]|nr:glycoside hydrolase family 88 protein [Phycisphaerae bacterium]
MSYRLACLIGLVSLFVLWTAPVRADDQNAATPMANQETLPANSLNLNLPAECNPRTIGILLANNLLNRPTYATDKSGLAYYETCSAFGAIRFADAIGDQDLLNKLIAHYQSIITPEGKRLVPPPNNIDHSVFGILPLEIYFINGQQPYLDLGKHFADGEWSKPRPDGLSGQTRFYLDDVYKLSVVQVLVFRVTGDKTYLDRGIAEALAYIDRLQQPNGLFFHGNGAHVFWGRGDGWMAAALTEMLLNVPADNPDYPRLMNSYKKMMAGLIAVQAPDGMWRQVLDDPKAWEESSCTGMFVFALAVGLREGWITGPEYKDAVTRGWIAFCGHVGTDGNVSDVGILTEHSNDEAYYLARPKATGNLHGDMAGLWAAWALAGFTI